MFGVIGSGVGKWAQETRRETGWCGECLPYKLFLRINLTENKLCNMGNRTHDHGTNHLA